MEGGATGLLQRQWHNVDAATGRRADLHALPSLPLQIYLSGSNRQQGLSRWSFFSPKERRQSFLATRSREAAEQNTPNRAVRDPVYASGCLSIFVSAQLFFPRVKKNLLQVKTRKLTSVENSDETFVCVLVEETHVAVVVSVGSLRYAAVGSRRGECGKCGRQCRPRRQEQRPGRHRLALP